MGMVDPTRASPGHLLVDRKRKREVLGGGEEEINPLSDDGDLRFRFGLGFEITLRRVRRRQ